MTMQGKEFFNLGSFIIKRDWVVSMQEKDFHNLEVL